MKFFSRMVKVFLIVWFRGFIVTKCSFIISLRYVCESLSFVPFYPFMKFLKFLLVEWFKFHIGVYHEKCLLQKNFKGLV